MDKFNFENAPKNIIVEKDGQEVINFDEPVNEEMVPKGDGLDETPGDDLYNRFNKFVNRKVNKEAPPRKRGDGPRNPLFNPYK
jgi:hypothetical protein